ncbi:YHYH protein [Aureispira anguillae]|uniref:YHYH protein n=1 Tax=Aureispira anguillae TaxID=2864201 RepID=A0A915YKK9_9BACT|nr:YHYH protein [Aureispira anguillae]BDS14945.1 YHYH protein [Aureispira anguillae]
MKNRNPFVLCLFAIIVWTGCREEAKNCQPSHELDRSRGNCTVTLSTSPSYHESTNGNWRTINTNSIPNHQVGVFGKVSGAINPHAIAAQNETYSITTNPTIATSKTMLLSNYGPAYSFGVLMNGVEVDPIAAEPWPHEGVMAPNVNWTWNLEAMNIQIGLDCNNAHVQPQGKYHYHGSPTLYLAALNISTSTMTLVGWAADGFPIYYKYGYSDPQDATSAVVELTSSYQLKTGERPEDGTNGPCGTYNGIYSNDYEYSNGLGLLDECNGRTGVTPEFPNGTYYYVITDDFPSIPRCFVGTPSNDFKI